MHAIHFLKGYESVLHADSFLLSGLRSSFSSFQSAFLLVLVFFTWAISAGMSPLSQVNICLYTCTHAFAHNTHIHMVFFTWAISAGMRPRSHVHMCVCVHILAGMRRLSHTYICVLVNTYTHAFCTQHTHTHTHTQSESRSW
jgi:hypothetical protein